MKEVLQRADQIENLKIVEAVEETFLFEGYQ